ncbi:MAG: D-2-hydroxyacid dehydrogenase [Myxococcota bacterium]
MHDRDDAVFAELAGASLLIVGLGQIGKALARRAKAFEMEVVGVRRTAGDPPPGADRVVTLDTLDEALGRADHVCLALPLTPATHHLFDAARLARMKPSAYLYNVGRGGLVAHAALVEALRLGAIAGAGLDVFDPEPLPPTDALWQLDNVIVTPHVSGVTPRYYERFAPLLAANVARWLEGRALENQYEAGRGY